jgi:hypothetical protein
MQLRSKRVHLKLLGLKCFPQKIPSKSGVSWWIHSEEAPFVTPDLHRKHPKLVIFTPFAPISLSFIVSSHQIISDFDGLLHENNWHPLRPLICTSIFTSLADTRMKLGLALAAGSQDSCVYGKEIGRRGA